jgi:Leucine-rich repeat (LRR) protein
MALAALLALGLILGAAAKWIERGRRQDAIVQEIERHGGLVVYDYEYDENGKWVADANPSVPTWIRQVCGNGCFVGVTDVILGGRQVGSFDFARLRDLGTVQYLDVSKTDVSDETVRDICQIDSLEELRLDGNQRISDLALKHIGDLRALKRLDVSATEITDLSLMSVSRLQHLEHLSVAETNIGNQGVSALAELDSLRDIDLSFTKVTSDALVHIRELDQLEELRLCGTAVNDDHLEELKELRSLAVLDLSRTDITDKGIPALRLDSLRLLRIEDTDISYEAGMNLRATMPGCEVQHW